jgi:hypothetical protein
MRNFINFFLIAYAIDAALSTVDDLIAVLSGVQLLEPLRNLVGVGVFLLSIAVYVSLAVDSRPPKRILLPLTLLAAWAGLGFLPLPIFFQGHGILLVLSLLQLLLSGCAFLWVKHVTDGHWLLPPAFFERPAFRWKNTVWFASANIVLVPVVLVMLLGSSAYLYLDHKTAGFMQLGSEGLYLQERTYTRGDKQIHLMAMIHIGSREYYREISESLRADNTMVLAEGVTDNTNLLSDFPSYSKMADLIGLDTQENMALHGKLIKPEQLDDYAGETDDPLFVRADIDVKDLSEDARAFIRQVGELFNRDESFVDGLVDYMNWYSEKMTPEKEKRVMSEIIDKRNAVVLDYLDKALRYYNRIVIPWGALHMPGLEQALLEKGFTPVEQTSRLAVDYDRLTQQSAEQ